jgi:CheY-like chemotaxis protein/chemotaxis protein histidine kinase CheA
MAFDSLTQARQLFLAEALELCQQIKEGLLILVHAPTPLTYQKLVRRVQILRQGAYSLELIDIGLLGDGLEAVLEACSDSVNNDSFVHELLHHLCDGLQLSLMIHSSIADTNTALSQREFAIHSLIPKVLEVFEVASTPTLPAQLQSRLLLQQVQWIQFLSQSLDFSELKTLANATLTALEASPEATLAIAQVALAGFQVAHEATIYRLTAADARPTAPLTATEPQLEEPQRPLRPSEQALEVFNTGQHLVGLTNRTLFCVATESIEEITLLETSQLQHKDGHEQILWRDRLLVLHRFIDLWQPTDSSTSSTPSRKRTEASALVLILNYESQPLALALEVERLIVEPDLKLERPEGASYPCSYGVATIDEGVKAEVVDVNCLLQQFSANGSRLQGSVNGDRLSVAAASILKAKVETAGWAQPAAIPQAKTILIVDDSRTVREMLTLTLKGAGYAVLQAQDGQQAIEHLQRQNAIHLTICDIEMSNLNGFEFLRHRLQDPRWVHIPVLILSSHTDQAYRQLAYKLGAADYFTIPYEDAALIQRIENLLTPNFTNSA